MKNFWETLPTPFFALAPLEDVTDAAFRRLIAKRGKPHVMFTEFTSADGLILADADGQKRLRKKLIFSESERPIVAQLFTNEPMHMEIGAKMMAEMGFDGFDINMGCPVNEVVRQGCGAALIKDPKLARELIRAAKRGWKIRHPMSNLLPISIKTRIGYDKDELEEWLPQLLAEEPAAITLHARTRKEMSDVPAHWDRIARAVQIRDELGSKTLIVGNGDVKDITHAKELVQKTGCDGVMLGRSIFGNPWLFSSSQEFRNESEAEHKARKIDALIEHLELFEELLSTNTNYAVMKKHYKAYISGWDGAKDLRVRLMETESVVEAQTVLREVHRDFRTYH